VRFILLTARSSSLSDSDVKTFISGRRFDSFSLHYVLQGIKLASIPWLGSSPPPDGHTSVTDTNKRRSLFESFLFWYIDAFVLPIVKTTFYVTESSAFRNRILFFRQDDWAVLCAPLIDRLTESTFRKLEAEEAEEMLRQRKLGFSFVRLLPKKTGVRPIVNLRRRKAVQKVSVL
jgi:telomerase reverse transcriptase